MGYRAVAGAGALLPRVARLASPCLPVGRGAGVGGKGGDAGAQLGSARLGLAGTAALLRRAVAGTVALRLCVAGADALLHWVARLAAPFLAVGLGAGAGRVGGIGGAQLGSVCLGLSVWVCQSFCQSFCHRRHK